MLEPVVGLRRQALDQHDVGFGEPFQCGAQGGVIHAGNVAQQRIGKAAADHGGNLRHLARGAEAVETRHQGLL